MERIEFWRKELQGARLYDGRAKDSFSRICAALEANSGTSFSAACAGGHHAPSEDGVRAHWLGQVSARRAGAYGTGCRTRRRAAGCDWTEVLGESRRRLCQDGSASSDADRRQDGVVRRRKTCLGR